jgi:hypothetical protein
MKIADIRESVRNNNIVWYRHALERMLTRGISRVEVRQVILNGEVIEDYPDDYPLPSCLIFHNDIRPLHVVVSYDEINQTVYIITAYLPDSKHFETDFRTRKKL